MQTVILLNQLCFSGYIDDSSYQAVSSLNAYLASALIITKPMAL